MNEPFARLSNVQRFTTITQNALSKRPLLQPIIRPLLYKPSRRQLSDIGVIGVLGLALVLTPLVLTLIAFGCFITFSYLTVKSHLIIFGDTILPNSWARRRAEKVLQKLAESSNTKKQWHQWEHDIKCIRRALSKDERSKKPRWTKEERTTALRCLTESEKQMKAYWANELVRHCKTLYQLYFKPKERERETGLSNEDDKRAFFQSLHDQEWDRFEWMGPREELLTALGVSHGARKKDDL